MPLLIKELHGVSRPACICDHCGREILAASDGNYMWKDKGDGTIYFTHKKCCRSFETDGDTQTRVYGWMAIGLECLPVYMARNLFINWEEAKVIANAMAGHYA